MSYAIDLANRISKEFTKDAQVVNAAYYVAVMEVGRKSANYSFFMDEDFTSDLVTEYFRLKKDA